ncbi:MAG: hypothetical protein DMG13_19640 [Acidobacteria bacterium]|nr:MAG: hypothetical protein DMG13_19640 [Acidobacteriota bacterium]
MLLWQVFRFVEDVRLGIDLETGIRQSKPRRDLADTHDGRQGIIRRPQRLFPKFGAERNTIFVQDVAQPFGHPERAP